MLATSVVCRISGPTRKRIMPNTSHTDLVRRYDMPAGELKRRIWRWANTTASGGTATLLGVIATRYNMETGLICPSIETVMGDYERAWHNVNTGQYFAPSERTVRSWLAPLKGTGIVTVVQNKGKRNRHGHRQASWWSSNQYVMDFTKALVNGKVIDHDFLAPLEAPTNSADEAAVEAAAITGSSNRSLELVQLKNDVEVRADATDRGTCTSQGSTEAEGVGSDFAYQGAVVVSSRISSDFPGSPPTNIGVIAREFRVALEIYSEKDLVAAVTHWFEGRRNSHGKGMLNPAGRFMSELFYYLDLAAASPEMRYHDFCEILDRGTFLSEDEYQAFSEFEQYWQGEYALCGWEEDKALKMILAYHNRKQEKLKRQARVEEERQARVEEERLDREEERLDREYEADRQKEYEADRQKEYERGKAETPSFIERMALAAIRQSEIKEEILASREADSIHAATHVLPAKPPTTTKALQPDDGTRAAALSKWLTARKSKSN